MTEDRAKLLEMMRKVATLANPEHTTIKAEMEAAASKLSSLMEKFNVSWAELLASEEKEAQSQYTVIQCNDIIGRVTQWHWVLARAIGRMTTTRHYIQGAVGHTFREHMTKLNTSPTRGHRFMFFGPRGAAETAAYMFDLWMKIIYDMGREATKDYVARMTEEYAEEMAFEEVKQFRHLSGLGSEHPNVWQKSWLEGLSSGVLVQVVEQQAEVKSAVTSNAIVLVKTEVDQAYKRHSEAVNMKSAKTTRRSSTNWEAYAEGSAIGKGLNLHPSSPTLGKGKSKLKGV